MSRSGYSEDCDDEGYNLYRGRVSSAIRGKRGQAFLLELAAAMDAMPVKELIADELIDDAGQCCAIGVVCKARGVDVAKLDYECPSQVGAAVNIATPMAAEIEYENDEQGYGYFGGKWRQETPAERWQRMRKWVEERLMEGPKV